MIYLFIFNHVTTIFYIVASRLVQHNYISVKLGNVIRLVSAILNSVVVCSILYFHFYNYISFLIIGGYIPGFILAFLIQLFFIVYHIRCDYSTAHVFLSTIMVVPLLIIMWIIDPGVYLIAPALYLFGLAYLAIIVFTLLNNAFIEAFIANVPPYFSFIDPFIKEYKDRGRLIIGTTSATIFTILNLINVCSMRDAGIIQRFACFLLIAVFIFHVIVGIRLLAEAKQIRYPISFVFDILENIYKNIKICINQLKENKFPISSALVQITTLVICIALSSSALAASMPNSPDMYDPNSPIEAKPPEKAAALGEGAAASKSLTKVTKAAYAKIPDSVKPMADHTRQVVIREASEMPAKGALNLAHTLATAGGVLITGACTFLYDYTFTPANLPDSSSNNLPDSSSNNLDPQTSYPNAAQRIMVTALTEKVLGLETALAASETALVDRGKDLEALSLQNQNNLNEAEASKVTVLEQDAVIKQLVEKIEELSKSN